MEEGGGRGLGYIAEVVSPLQTYQLKPSLLDKTHLEDDGTTQLDIAGEIAVIVGALASEGSLTIRQLLEARAAEELLSLVRRLADRSSFASTNLGVSALRALRNILVSTADITWGNMWGVGRERSVVGTGLVGPESDERIRDVQMTLSGGGEGVDLGNREGKRILSLVFSVSMRPFHLLPDLWCDRLADH